MSAALALATLLAAGAALAAALLGGAGWSRGERIAWSLALAPGLGAGFLSLAFVGHRALALRPPAGPLVACEVAAVALAIVWLRARFGRPAPLPAETGERGRPLPLALAAVAVVAAGAAALRAAVAFAREVPLGAWDAVATWNLRARLLARAGADWISTLDAANYPLLLPGAVAGQWRIAGGESGLAASGLGAAFVAAAALAVALAPGRRGRLPGVAAAALLLATPTLLVQGFSQEADVPIAALLAAGLALLAARLEDGPAPPAAAAGALLGGLAWTKNEGLLWAVLAVAAFTVAGRRRAWRDLGALAAGAAPGLAALGLWKSLATPAGGFGAASLLAEGWGSRLADPARWLAVLDAIAERLAPWRSGFAWSWAWTPLALGLVLAAARGRGRAPRPALRCWSLALGACGAALVLVYVLTPLPLDWHLATSLDRLLLQLYPSALAGVAAALAAPVGGAGPGRAIP